jgi:hypothetical protein
MVCRSKNQGKFAVKNCDVSNSFAAHIAKIGHSKKWDDFTSIDGHKYQTQENKRISVHQCFSNSSDATGKLLVWMIVETSGNVQYPHSSSVQAQMYILFF